jgi:hypothetical protein
MRVIAKWVAIGVVIYLLVAQTDRTLDAAGKILGKLGDLALRVLESFGGTVSIDIIAQIAQIAQALTGA